MFYTLFFRWEIQRLNGSEWSLPAELIRENTNRDFVIKSQIFQEHLKPGGQCIVKLETWREGGRTGYVTKILRVNEPPKPGNCSCYPPTGNISHTEFQISCDGWVDSEKPLLYSFSYRRNDNGTKPLLTSLENPSSSRKFRIYEQVSQDVLSVNISIYVSVEDALGMSSWYEVKLQVQLTSRSTLKFNLLDKRLPAPQPSELNFWFKGDYVTRDDSQRRFLAHHSVATLLRHCFEWLQHCSDIATPCCAKNRRCESGVQCNITVSPSSAEILALGPHLCSKTWVPCTT